MTDSLFRAVILHRDIGGIQEDAKIGFLIDTVLQSFGSNAISRDFQNGIFSPREKLISIQISPIEMEIGNGSGTVLLELYKLLKLYNSSSSAGADDPGAGRGSEGMEIGTISGITDLRYSSLAMRFQ